jgi:hypothetical protein
MDKSRKMFISTLFNRIPHQHYLTMQGERVKPSPQSKVPGKKHTVPPQKNIISACIDNAFDDKRVTIACISVWFVICAVGFTWLGIFGSEYMRVGPSATLTYMGMSIDTMGRYLTVVGFVVISTAINDFASDAISPWIQNTVMDHKTRTIPYSKFTILFIAQTWSLYCGVMSVASIALVFAQFDLIMIRLVVDLFVNQYTIRRFLIKKSHDPFRYHNEFAEADESDLLSEEGDPSDTRNQDIHGGVQSTDFVIETEEEKTSHHALYNVSSVILKEAVIDSSVNVVQGTQPPKREIDGSYSGTKSSKSSKKRDPPTHSNA